MYSVCWILSASYYMYQRFSKENKLDYTWWLGCYSMNTTKLLILSSINQRLVIDTYRVGAHFIRLTSCSPLRDMLVNVMFEMFRRSQEFTRRGQRYSKITTLMIEIVLLELKITVCVINRKYILKHLSIFVR